MSEANFNGRHSYNGSSKGEYRERTVPVGRYNANQFGLHDVHGNVYEWVEDCSNDHYTGAPSDGDSWTTDDCSYRVFRGGSWFDRPRGLRSSLRIWIRSDYRYFNIGFRVARRGGSYLPTQVDLLTQERDQLKAELARKRDNAAWLNG